MLTVVEVSTTEVMTDLCDTRLVIYLKTTPCKSWSLHMQLTME